MVERIRQAIFKLLIILIFLSFILAVLSELMPNGWLALLAIIFISSYFLLVYVYDPRIYYRRLVPLFVCVGAVTYRMLRPILKHTLIGRQIFRKCYKIKKLSGSFTNCYHDVQDVYDEYSNYNVE